MGGYNLQGSTCVENVCSCSNGQGATNTNCPVNGQAKCVSCNAGFNLAGDACNQNVCTCSNGNGATGTNCPTHNSAKCVSCNGGFNLEGTTCVQAATPVPGMCVSNCPSQSLVEKCFTTAPLDLVFVLDGSSSVKESDFVGVVNFLRSATSAFNIGPQNTRIAATQYSSHKADDEKDYDQSGSNCCNPGYDVEFHFDDNPQSVLSEFKHETHYRHGKGTYTGHGITRAYEDVIKNRARGGVQVKMVVITDGQSSGSSPPGGPANDMRNKGIEVIAIGWGNYEMDDLRDIAGCDNCDRILTASSAGDLSNRVQEIVEEIC